MLRNSGLLNQDKVITARGPEFEPPLNSFIYAIELSNAIQIQVPSLDHLDYVKSFFKTMQIAAKKTEKMPYLDIFVKYHVEQIHVERGRYDTKVDFEF